MPNASQHENKAKHNRQFLETIDCGTTSDWAAVVAFYTAVHVIERLRALDGDHSKDHQDRLQYVATHHRTIHTEFHGLLNASYLARYQANATFFGQISNDDVKSNLIDRFLVAIEGYAENYVATKKLHKSNPSPKINDFC